jgi:hypothetical protein
VFWLPQQLRSGVGLCLRHTGDKHIAAVQLATTGILSAQYAHRVTDKVRELAYVTVMTNRVRGAQDNEQQQWDPACPLKKSFCV